MRCAIGEVNVKMIDPVASEKIREIKGVARALFSLDFAAISSLVPIDKLISPFAAGSCIGFPDSENLLWRRVMNWRAQPGDMFMAQTGEWRINRANL
jgi:hypothetical protein